MTHKYEDEELGDEAAGEPEDTPRTFEDLVESAPAREVALPEEPRSGRAGVTESMEMVPDLSDMQTVFLEMFPKTLGSPVGNKLMMARIAPEAFLDVIGMRVDNRVMTSDPEKDINVDEMITEEYVLASIGLDGRGRIDAAELAGAAREQKLETQRLKEL